VAGADSRLPSLLSLILPPPLACRGDPCDPLAFLSIRRQCTAGGSPRTPAAAAVCDDRQVGGAPAAVSRSRFG
jgi:hypothetical protein